MEVRRVEEVRQAEIERDKQVVAAEQDKQTTVIIADGELEAEKKKATGIEVVGKANAEAEKAMQLAPVQAQIELAKEIGNNAGYMQYLMTVEGIKGYVVVGGERDGNFFPVTVLTGVTPENDAYREEFFGPVATVYKVASEDEAIELANDTPFGLGSYVFSTDPEQAQRVAAKLDTGMVFVNGVGLDGAELPFGGVKRSGFGRELGSYGIQEFINKKLIRTLK